MSLTKPRNVHFILDCDDVLLDWQRGFRAWVYAHHGIRPEAKGPKSWSLFTWLGVPEARCMELIADFNASQAFGELYPMDGAIEAVAMLHQAGHQITVLTSCSADPLTIARRKENLQRVFGTMVERVICLALGESKRGWLDVLVAGVWVEDNYKNAMVGADAGHTAFMLRRRHNRDDEHKEPDDSPLVWLDDWQPILSTFC
jgi:FMN phosphatase YigB (HAD superfamily)